MPNRIQNKRWSFVQHEPAPKGQAQQPTALPVFLNCMLGNSNVEMTRHRHIPAGGPSDPVTQDGSCTMSVSCIERQGKDTPGDGRVALICAKGQCSCQLEPLTPPGPVVEFRFSAACMTSEQAQQLMLENCLKGMHLLAPATAQ
jgi:hypothetical protein